MEINIISNTYPVSHTKEKIFTINHIVQQIFPVRICHFIVAIWYFSEHLLHYFYKVPITRGIFIQDSPLISHSTKNNWHREKDRLHFKITQPLN